MTKKLWLGAGFLPLVIAPAAIVASCSNDNNTTTVQPDQVPTLPSENQSDVNKAIANIKMLFYGHISTFHLFKASEFGPTQAKNQKPFPKAYLPKLDPRQNFGFQSEYQTVEDNDATGLKKVKVILTRGKEKKEETLEIKGFLTSTAATNESASDSKVNPEKVFKNFNRSAPQFALFRGLLIATVNNGTDIKTYLAKDAQSIVDEVKNQILNSSASGQQNQQQATNQNVEIKAVVNKPVQWSTFGVMENMLRIDVQIVEKQSTTQQQAAPKKSGIYSLRISGFAENEDLFNDANFNAAAYGFNTLNSPVKGPDGEKKKWYSDKKASEITTQDLLNAELDKGLYNQVLVLEEITLISNSANDQEGSLRVNAKIKFNNKPAKTMNFKLYGCQIDPSK